MSVGIADVPPPSNVKPLLTIGIPTFNRAESLDEKLAMLAEAIAAQGLEGVVEILVSDNASADRTQQVLAATRPVAVRSLRNGANLGCDANYLRILEFAGGEWCWLLGDDEPIAAGALGRLVERLGEESADAVHLIVPTEPCRQERLFRSVDELVSDFYSLAAIQHLSTNVLRQSFARRHLAEGYRVAGKLHAYTPIVLGSILEGRGLRTYDLPLLQSAGEQRRRWNQLRAVVGAVETMVESTPASLRVRVEGRAIRETKHLVLSLFLRQLIGASGSQDDKAMRDRLLRLYGLGHWDAALAVGTSYALVKSGLLPIVVEGLERVAPTSRPLRWLRQAYGLSTSESVAARIRAVNTSERDTGDEY